jgi:hypothetical protein
VETAAGTLVISILGNRIEFVEDDDGIEIDDLLYFGDGGSASVTIDHNRIISTEDAGIDIDYVETQIIDDAGQIDGPTSVIITNNWLALNDDGVADIDGLVCPAEGTASFVFDNNDGSNIESTAFEVDDHSLTGPGPVDGRIEFFMRNNRLEASNNGDSPDLELATPPGPDGLLMLVLEDNFLSNPDGSPLMDLEIDETLGSDEGLIYNQSVLVQRNLLLETNDDADDPHIFVDCFTGNGSTTVDILQNVVAASSGGIEIEHTDRSGGAPVVASLIPIGSTSISILENDIFTTGERGIYVDADATGGGITTIDILHNRVRTDEDSIYVEIDSGALPNGRVFTNVFNNRVDGTDDEQFQYFDFTDTTNGEAAYAFVGQNTFAYGQESSGTEIEVGENGIVLFANNFVGFGEVDSDDGLELFPAGSNPGLLYVRNNLMAFNPGDAIYIEDTNPQLINNTVAFNVMGGDDSDFGIFVDGDEQPYIHNSIVYRNGGGDLENAWASYSLIGDEDPPMGWGNVTGDPIFDFSPDLFAFDHNFRLRLGSPAIDAGDPEAVFNDPDGSRNDMGAYGGPGAGRIGSLLPDDPLATTPADMPEVPLLALGLARPFDPSATLVALVDLYTGSPLRSFGPNDPISVVFSRPIDAATTGGIFVSADGLAVPGGFTLSDGGRVATFTPAAPVADGAVIRVEVGLGVLAFGTGAPLAVPYTKEFGVAPLATPEAEAAGGPDTNGSSGTAEPIPGNPSTLNLAGALFAGDADFFSFTGTAGERVQATVVSQRLATATPGGMTLTLYDTDGTTILAQNDNNVGPLGGPRTDAFVDFTLPASGTYFLAVSDGTAGPYQIHWFVR